MLRQPEAPKQPTWVCLDCGQKYGRWYTNGVYHGPSPWCATYHQDHCDVCQRDNVTVTEARDFGYLVPYPIVKVPKQQLLFEDQGTPD